MDTIKRISIIGSGNVAHHLGHKLFQQGYDIVNVWSRSYSNASTLAKRLNAHPVINTKELATCDLVLICVPDDAIKKVCESIEVDAIYAHTSGTRSIDDLSGKKNFGIFYPLQSLSKNNLREDIEIPILIEANNVAIEEVLTEVAKEITSIVHSVDSEKRKQLHVGAVIVNNFTNHLYTLAKEFCEDHNADFDILKPLILETALKIKNMSPESAQTGPAKRKDKNTLDQHIKLLNEHKDLKDLYLLFTKQLSEKT